MNAKQNNDDKYGNNYNRRQSIGLMVLPDISFCSLSLQLDLSVGIIFAIVTSQSWSTDSFGVVSLKVAYAYISVLSGKTCCVFLPLILYFAIPTSSTTTTWSLPSCRNGEWLTFFSIAALDQLSGVETGGSEEAVWSCGLPPSYHNQPALQSPSSPLINRLSFLSHSRKADSQQLVELVSFQSIFGYFKSRLGSFHITISFLS